MKWIINFLLILFSFILFLAINVVLFISGNIYLIIVLSLFLIFSLMYLYNRNNNLFYVTVVFLIIYTWIYSIIFWIWNNQVQDLTTMNVSEEIKIEKNLEKCFESLDCNIQESYQKDLNQINQILENPVWVISAGKLYVILFSINQFNEELLQNNINYKNDISINYQDFEIKIYNSIYTFNKNNLSATSVNLFYSENQFKNYLNNSLYVLDEKMKNNEEILEKEQSLNIGMLVNRKYMYEYFTAWLSWELKLYSTKINQIKNLLQ